MMATSQDPACVQRRSSASRRTTAAVTGRTTAWSPKSVSHCTNVRAGRLGASAERKGRVFRAPSGRLVADSEAAQKNPHDSVIQLLLAPTRAVNSGLGRNVLSVIQKGPEVDGRLIR